ncbi:MAG TPA: NfeD family protein, partial [Hyphomicrobium sp.]
MQSVSALIAQFGAWLWFALAVLLLVLESLVPGVHFVWFGLSAMIVGVIALAVVFWVRQKSREESSKPDVPDLNVRGAQYIGRVVTIEDAI